MAFFAGRSFYKEFNKTSENCSRYSTNVKWLNQLLINKRVTGRRKDLADLEALDEE